MKRNCCAKADSEKDASVHGHFSKPQGLFTEPWGYQGWVIFRRDYNPQLWLFNPSRAQIFEPVWPVTKTGYLVFQLCKLKNSVGCLNSSKVWFDQNTSQEDNKKKKTRTKNQHYDFN